MGRHLVFLLLFALAAATGCASARPSPGAIEGFWSGRFEREGSILPVELEFRRDGEILTGRFSANDLRAAGIPLRDVRQTGGAVHFVLAGDETTAAFDGVIERDTLTGAYVEDAARETFAFTRAPAAPPACAETPARFANGDVTLAGTLLSPARTPAQAAVLFLHGSRAESRDASRFTALAFCRAGFAALIYDKRGVGDSSGNWRDASFENLAGDAVGGLDWLAARTHINAARIGLYGHSQGGSLAPLVAMRWPRIAFIIAGAGAGQPMAEVERYSLRNAVAPYTRDGADRRDAEAFVDRIVEAGATGPGLDALIADAPRYADRAWFAAVEPPPADSFYWGFQRRIAAYDSTAHWAHVRAPVMLIYGARDERVPVEPSGLIPTKES